MTNKPTMSKWALTDDPEIKVFLWVVIALIAITVNTPAVVGVLLWAAAIVITLLVVMGLRFWVVTTCYQLGVIGALLAAAFFFLAFMRLLLGIRSWVPLLIIGFVLWLFVL